MIYRLLQGTRAHPYHISTPIVPCTSLPSISLDSLVLIPMPSFHLLKLPGACEYRLASLFDQNSYLPKLYSIKLHLPTSFTTILSAITQGVVSQTPPW